jgi:hypothetical protein
MHSNGCAMHLFGVLSKKVYTVVSVAQSYLSNSLLNGQRASPFKVKEVGGISSPLVTLCYLFHLVSKSSLLLHLFLSFNAMPNTLYH